MLQDSCLDLVWNAISRIENEQSRIGFLLETIESDLDCLTESQCCLVVKRVACVFADGLAGFCGALQKYLETEQDKILNACDFQVFLRAVIQCLTEELLEDYSAKMSSSSHLSVSGHAIFFASKMTAEHAGAVKNLMRLLGEKQSTRWMSRNVLDKFLAGSSYDELRGAFIEGLIKHEGPSKVWQVYENYSGGNLSPEGAIEMDEGRFASALSNMDPNSAGSVNQCKLLYRMLVAGGGEARAKAVVERVRPDILPEMLGDETSTTIGRRAE